MSINIEFTLDDDGYLDRSCPICERDFRWHEGPVGELPVSAPEIDSYHCPYCGEESPADEWWTLSQVESIQQAAFSDLSLNLAEYIRKTEEEVRRIASLGPLGGKAPTLDPKGIGMSGPFSSVVDGSDSFIAVASPCHPYEPIKIAANWAEPVHCLVCGQRFSVPDTQPN